MRGAETDESRTPQTVKQLTEQFKEMGREQVAHFEAQGTDSTHSVLEEMDPHVLFAYAKRRLEREKERNQTYCGHRATVSTNLEVTDNSALSIFFGCPGAGRGQRDVETFLCTVRDAAFGDVVPDETDPIIRSLKFSSIFSLARLISIFENEVDIDKKRYLMRTPSYNFITVSGAEKAYTFFKRRCEHVLKALLKHDGSSIAVIPRQTIDIDRAQLNDLTNAGARYAITHIWEDVQVKGPKLQTLVLLPNGFRGYARVVMPDNTVTMSIYNDLKDAATIIRSFKDLGVCVFVTPTTERPFAADEWQGLAMAITTAVRCGSKVLAVSGPRGEAAWQQNRNDAQEMFEVVRNAAKAMKENVVTMFTSVPSITEPFACLGEHSRETMVSVYPAQAAKAFLMSLQNYVMPYIRGTLFEALQEPVSRRQAYKEKRSALVDRDKMDNARHNRASREECSIRGNPTRGRARGYGRSRGNGSGWKPSYRPY